MSDRKYMTLKDVKLRQPLASVKLAENGTDALVIPKNFSNTVIRFLKLNKIKYTLIENPTDYTKRFLKSGLKRYAKNSKNQLNEPHVLITPFNADSLFEWSLQLFGNEKDPSYAQYINSRRKETQEYYEANRPDIPFE